MMRWSSIVSEAWRNVTSGTAQTAQRALLLAALSAAAVGVDLAAVSGISLRAAEFHAAGGDVLIIEAPARINPRACEALNATDGMTAAALRAATENVVASVLPSSSIPTYETTPGMTAVLLDDQNVPSGGGLIVSRAVADAFGLSASSAFETLSGTARVAHIYRYPADGRRPDLEFAILTPVSSDAPFDQCWVRSSARSDDVASLLLGTLLPAASPHIEPPAIAQLNGSLGETFSGAEQFAERPTRHLPLMCVALAFVLCCFATQLRRVELAAARHSGVTLAEQWAILMLESLAPVLWAVIATVPVATWFVVRAAITDIGTYLELAVRLVSLIGLFALLGVSLGVLLIRESHLFSHFKDRR